MLAELDVNQKVLATCAAWIRLTLTMLEPSTPRPDEHPPAQGASLLAISRDRAP